MRSALRPPRFPFFLLGAGCDVTLSLILAVRGRSAVQLTTETIDQLLAVIPAHAGRTVDLRNVDFVDPYALLVLALAFGSDTSEQLAVDVRWPTNRAVRRWMAAMGLGREVPGFSPSGLASAGGTALQPITRIAREADVSRLVAAFDDRLSARYPLTGSSRHALVKVMLELFQNIPQHGNATGELVDPHGLAAMQDYADSIFLAVADAGIGLCKSLSLRGEAGTLTDARALDRIVFEGMSRFTDPGRGGELRRIAQLVRRWDGVFALRSGQAVLYIDTERGGVYDAPPFPGVQIAVRIPRRVFGIDEPPVDSPPVHRVQ